MRNKCCRCYYRLVSLLLYVTLASVCLSSVSGFTLAGPTARARRTESLSVPAGNDFQDSAAPETTKGTQVEEYRNLATKVLSNFLQKKESEDNDAGLSNIDFDAPKVAKMPLATLAAQLDADLYDSEWFVTGRVNPSYFAASFKFQDPDVKVSGIADYAKGVNKLFDQATSRAEIISTEVNPDTPNTITCTWRLSGKVSVGPGLTIKPYIVYTDFTVNPATGLIVFQQDRFSLPQWDILLSSLFPWTIGKITAPPAPPVEPRTVSRPAVGSVKDPRGILEPLGGFAKMFNNLFS